MGHKARAWQRHVTIIDMQGSKINRSTTIFGCQHAEARNVINSKLRTLLSTQITVPSPTLPHHLAQISGSVISDATAKKDNTWKACSTRKYSPCHFSFSACSHHSSSTALLQRPFPALSNNQEHSCFNNQQRPSRLQRASKRAHINALTIAVIKRSHSRPQRPSTALSNNQEHSCFNKQQRPQRLQLASQRAHFL
jgi:hypothetical protein